MLSTGSMDGFVSTSVYLTKHMKYLLHYLLTTVLPEYWTNRAAAERLGPLYVSLSSSQPEALFGHLATAAMHLHVNYGHSEIFPESHPVRRSLEVEHIAYKREAMRLFNHKLTAPGAALDKSTFHVLMSLLVTEVSQFQDQSSHPLITYLMTLFREEKKKERRRLKNNLQSMAQDETGITAHLNGFQMLVALRGGIATVPEYLKMGLTTCVIP